MKYDKSIIDVESTICNKVSMQVDNMEIRLRYSLIVNLKDRHRNFKEASVIMMNPSMADEDTSDQTINKISKFFKDGETGIGRINFLNLIPIHSTDNKKLKGIYDSIINKDNSRLFKKIINKNHEVIEEKLVSSDIIVLAWGKPNKFPLYFFYNQQAEILRKVEKSKAEIYVFKLSLPEGYAILTNTGDPRHVSRRVIQDIVKVKQLNELGVVI